MCIGIPPSLKSHLQMGEWHCLATICCPPSPKPFPASTSVFDGRCYGILLQKVKVYVLRGAYLYLRGCLKLALATRGGIHATSYRVICTTVSILARKWFSIIFSFFSRQKGGARFSRAGLLLRIVK